VSIFSRLCFLLCLLAGELAAQAVAPGSSAEALRAGRFAEALRRGREQTAAATARGDERAAVYSLVDEARAHGQLADYPAALMALHEALPRAEKLVDEEPLATVEFMLGNIHGRLREWEDSEVWHQRALERKRRLGATDVYAPLAGLAFEKFNRGNYAGARSDYEEALALARQYGGLREIGEMLHGLGTAQLQLGEHDAAIRHLREAVEVRERMDDPYYRSYSMAELSAALRARGEKNEAADLLARAVPLAESTGSPRVLSAVYREAAAAAAERGEWEAAYGFLQRFHDASQRELDEVRAHKAAVLAARFEAVEREQQIATLTKQRELEAAGRSRAEWMRNYFITIGAGAVFTSVLALVAYRYKRQAASAATVRAERAQLTMLRYQLNPHLLFNTLNSIRSLVLTDPAKARDLVSRLSAFCRRTLMPGDAALVTLREEWTALHDFLALEQARWEDMLTVESEFDPAAEDLLVPPMLLQPLVENAVKYGQQTTPGDLRIRLEARVAKDALTLSVANLGRWVPPSATPRDDSVRVGLENVRARLAAVYGDRAALTTAEESGWVVVSVRIARAVLRQGKAENREAARVTISGR
jgi:Putative regulator of cell autolysis